MQSNQEIRIELPKEFSKFPLIHGNYENFEDPSRYDEDSVTSTSTSLLFHHLPCKINKDGIHETVSQYFPSTDGVDTPHFRGRPLVQRIYTDFNLLLLVSDEGRRWECQKFNLTQNQSVTESIPGASVGATSGLVNWGLDDKEEESIRQGFQWMNTLSSLVMKKV